VMHLWDTTVILFGFSSFLFSFNFWDLLRIQIHILILWNLRKLMRISYHHLFLIRIKWFSKWINRMRWNRPWVNHILLISVLWTLLWIIEALNCSHVRNTALLLKFLQWLSFWNVESLFLIWEQNISMFF